MALGRHSMSTWTLMVVEVWPFCFACCCAGFVRISNKGPVLGDYGIDVSKNPKSKLHSLGP